MTELAAAEWTSKSNVVADAALEASGLSGPQEFCDILSESRELNALAQRILLAAYLSGYEDKLRTLGALLGRAAARRGERLLAETELLAAALADIEKQHVVVLDLLTGSAPDEEDQRRVTEGALAGGLSFSAERTGDELVSWEQGAWLPEHIEAEVPLLPEFVLACLSALTRHGLVRAVATIGGGQRFKITDFGRALVEVMNQFGGV